MFDPASANPDARETLDIQLALGRNRLEPAQQLRKALRASFQWAVSFRVHVFRLQAGRSDLARSELS